MVAGRVDAVGAVRLFVAVWLPSDAVDVLAAVPRPDVDGVRWTTEDQWHVTLRFLGEVESEAPAVRALAAAGAARTEAVMGPESRRLGSHVLMAPVAGLDEVAAAVVASTAHLGKPPDGRPFRGHVTLARVRAGRRADLRALTGVPVRARWPVDRVSLVRSTLHPTGARYDTIAEVDLAAG